MGRVGLSGCHVTSVIHPPPPDPFPFLRFRGLTAALEDSNEIWIAPSADDLPPVRDGGWYTVLYGYYRLTFEMSTLVSSPFVEVPL